MTTVLKALLLALFTITCFPGLRADVPAGDRPTGPIVKNGEKEPKEWVIPNGRIIRPCGIQKFVGGFPLGIALTPDEKHLLVTNCGMGRQSVSVLDADTLETVDDAEVKTLFNGIAVSSDGKWVWVCGGGAQNVQRFQLVNGKLRPAAPIPVSGYPTAAILSRDNKTLYVTCNLARCVRIVDTEKKAVTGKMDTGTFPYAIQQTPDGRKAYVTNWADGTVTVLDLKEKRPLATISAGGLPCAVALSPDGKRAYVANANTDDLTVIDAEKDVALGTVSLPPYPNAPKGAMPNGLAFAPDGRTLYVTMAGINAVVLVSVPQHQMIALLPTAWYPTGITRSKDGRTLYVVNSKGVGSGPNKDGGYIGSMMRGTVQKLAPGDADEQRRYTAEVSALNGFANARARRREEEARWRGSDALPKGIKHVVFLVRENRTYDQVLGDLGYGNGDPALTIFGKEVTPNLHELAQRYAVGDNMYGDGEVSLQGHQWTLGANCPDYVEKVWMANYSQRGRLVDVVPGPASYPALGYMMDHCVRNGVSCRMYGDIVRRVAGGKPVPELADKVATTYPGWNLSIPDVERAKRWQEEFDRGIFPAFTYIWLPNDHTAGTVPGKLTPRAMVADNDLATGLIIGALSRHPEWKDTVVFLTEDDTQDGRDHVDAHRNVLLVISPWVRPGSLTGRHYSIASIYATIERLLNLPPMSQYDDLADPITGIWLPAPDPKPYSAILNRVPLDERNPPNAPMARESMRLDLNEPDSRQNTLLAEILWQAMKGRRASIRAR